MYQFLLIYFRILFLFFCTVNAENVHNLEIELAPGTRLGQDPTNKNESSRTIINCPTNKNVSFDDYNHYDHYYYYNDWNSSQSDPAYDSNYNHDSNYNWDSNYNGYSEYNYYEYDDFESPSCIVWMSTNATVGKVDFYTDGGMPTDLVIFPHYDYSSWNVSWMTVHRMANNEVNYFGYQLIHSAEWINIFCRDDLNDTDDDTRCIDPTWHPLAPMSKLFNQSINQSMTTIHPEPDLDSAETKDTPNLLGLTNIIDILLMSSLICVILMCCWLAVIAQKRRNRRKKKELQTQIEKKVQERVAESYVENITKNVCRLKYVYH